MWVHAAFRQEAKEKSKRKAEQVKKRKAEEAERLHPHQSTDVTEHIADIATQGKVSYLQHWPLKWLCAAHLL